MGFGGGREVEGKAVVSSSARGGKIKDFMFAREESVSGAEFRLSSRAGNRRLCRFTLAGRVSIEVSMAVSSSRVGISAIEGSRLEWISGNQNGLLKNCAVQIGDVAIVTCESKTIYVKMK